MLTVGTEGNEKIIHVEALYREFHADLVAFSKEIVGRNEVAEDVVSELFVALLDKEVTFLNMASLRSYLYTAIRNRSLDHLRHVEVENSYMETYLQESNLQREDSWEAAFDEELMQLLFAEIDRLPERCREVLLFSLDGLSNEEIALKCGIGIETVKTQKKRAKKMIRENLEERKDKKGMLLLIFLKILSPF